MAARSWKKWPTISPVRERRSPTRFRDHEPGFISHGCRLRDQMHLGAKPRAAPSSGAALWQNYGLAKCGLKSAKPAMNISSMAVRRGHRIRDLAPPATSDPRPPPHR
jgi:hypothetical protein